MQLSDKAKIKKKKYMREWRKKNRKTVNAYAKKWRQENPEKVKYYNQKYWENKARETGHE